MKRRVALKQIGLGVSAGLALPSWLTACSGGEDPKPSFVYDGRVAIIGAGAAGLYAADILQEKGINAMVLEASDRIGGRLRSLKISDKPSQSLLFTSAAALSSDFPTELGAEYILGSDSLWSKMIGQLNLSTVDLTANTTDNYILDGIFTTHADAINDSDFIAAKNFLDSLKTYGDSGVSVQQAIAGAGINARVHAILNSWIGNRYGASNSQLGVRPIAEALNKYTRDGKRLLLADNPMQDALLSRFGSVIPNVQLNMVVKAIDYSGSRVIISGHKIMEGNETESFTVEADKVIVTVPVSILKAGDITFSPGLPTDKAEAISNMEMDASVRVILDFKTNFWGAESGFLYGGTASPEYLNAGVGRSEGSKALSLTVNGPMASTFSGLGTDAIPLLLDELDTVFDGKASLAVRRDLNDNIISVIQDWTKEKYIRGGISYLKPGGANQDRTTLAATIQQKLFFAGEATDGQGEAGTISGALLSGERTAAEVLEVLGY